jgi:Peptidase M50B-like
MNMRKLPQLILVVSLLATCWLAMQVVHEFGHVLGAWCTGGTVVKVVLRPWTISRTEMGANPEPLVVTWAGPIVGAALPLLLWLAAKLMRCPGRYLLRFFAGFCLIANGAYISAGALDRIGDAGDLHRHGSPLWQLFAFGALTIPAGFWLWHGEGKHFGFGGMNGRVNNSAVAACVIAMLVVLILEFLVGSG